MKKFTKYILFISLGLLCSCSDYLDIVPDNVTTLDIVFNNKNTAQRYLANCYHFVPDHGSVKRIPGMDALPELYSKLKEMMDSYAEYEWEILFVNDGSHDKTLEVIKFLRSQDERINFVDLSRNFGKEVAMLAGFDYATGDCLVIMDADLQHPPHLIPEMLKYWEEGD